MHIDVLRIRVPNFGKKFERLCLGPTGEPCAVPYDLWATAAALAYGKCGGGQVYGARGGARHTAYAVGGGPGIRHMLHNARGLADR